MAQRAAKFWKVRDVVATFIAMGCEVRRTAQSEVKNPSTGREVSGVRYLYNPETGGFCVIDDDLEDDDQIPPSEFESWERRLGLLVPKPEQNT